MTRVIRLLLTVAALGCFVPCTSAGLSPDAQFSLRPAFAGPGPFGQEPMPGSAWLRVFPGETIDATVTAKFHSANLSGLNNTTLVPQLSVCMLGTGDHTDDILSGAPLNCLENVLAWSITAESNAAWHLRARLSANTATLPAGDYTAVVLLNSPALSTHYGGSAARHLRSTPLRLIVGPTASEDESLTSLYRQAQRAQSAGDSATVLTKTSQMLTIYPNSVLALCLRGNAYVEENDLVSAKAQYAQALNVLNLSGDTRTPQFADEERVRAQERWIKQMFVVDPPLEE